ncbi:MAG: hypothetical protein JWO78_2368 [Micavibrio sp.]|nr:hypothetical protein [Micavibrio sp.]
MAYYNLLAADISLIGRRGLLMTGALLFLTFIFSFAPRPALACGICDFYGNTQANIDIELNLDQLHAETEQIINDHTDEDFVEYRDWLTNDYFKERILPAMALMAEQMSAVAMQQMEILGALLDAKHQLETQRLFGQLAAQAHKDYQPSEGMCSIGTAARSLAGADRNAEVTALVLARRSQERQLLNVNSSSHEGRGSDRKSRAEQFKTLYCDVNDNNRGLNGVCANNVPMARKNKDIDYARTLWSPLTLDINLTNGDATDDETDIMALESNLYSHTVYEAPMSKANLENNLGNQQIYLNMRSIVAKRSVAENSFQALAAMKSRGVTDDAGTGQYLRAAIQQLNGDITADQATALIGSNPSYYAQMEVLTKKLLQDPQFFTDLYDKPANVARKGVALQAISLMQDRDFYKSNVRSEAILSVLLEMEVVNAQKKVQDEIDRLGK